jgi:hypothetical protein
MTDSLVLNHKQSKSEIFPAFNLASCHEDADESGSKIPHIFKFGTRGGE